MSFEDDEYWEEQYAPRRPASYADNTAVARDRYAQRYAEPEDDYDEPVEPVLPTRRTHRRPADPGDVQQGYNELAVRRQRRESGGGRAPRPGFDTQRPAWLGDPEFVPTDVSASDLAGPDSAVLDFNRPELGANFDGPEFPSTAVAARRGTPRRGPVRPQDADGHDETDEPFDHRVGMDRGSSIQSLAPDGYDARDDDWDDEPAR